jgi:hypothetical protein
MTGHARQVALPGPPAVAVHDDGDVRWDTPGVDGSRQREILRARREYLQQGFHY